LETIFRTTQGGNVHSMISLLHATHHRQYGPLQVKSCWLERADRPDLIDYIFAMDADDSLTVEQTAGHPRVVGPPSEQSVTAVKNWNAAAAVAKGDLLFVIADDLFPPRHWDTALIRIVGQLDPMKICFAVKVTDGPKERRVLLRHPVVSRAFYMEYGLFSDAYHGVYCDNDITMRAFWHAVILDGRSLVLEHRHPSLGKAPRSESHRRMMERGEYEYGRDTFLASWSLFRRYAHIQLISPVKGGLRPSDLPTPLRTTLMRAKAALRSPFVGMARWLLRIRAHVQVDQHGSRSRSS
jgi:hypothetical protein